MAETTKKSAATSDTAAQTDTQNTLSGAYVAPEGANPPLSERDFGENPAVRKAEVAARAGVDEEKK